MTKGRMLLVIPSVIAVDDGHIRVDVDFANNLRAYLAAFDEVCVMCPATTDMNTFPGVCELDEIAGSERLEFVVLPFAYREDTYLRNRRKVKALLEREIERADYLLITPHSAFDWSTLAAKICVRKSIPYNMEADWNLPGSRAIVWRQSPWGIDKVRKWFWRLWHDRQYYDALRHSSLSLMQGGDVFHDLGSHAPNPFSVLNVQMREEEHIGEQELAAKVERAASVHMPTIAYGGRATDVKGPFLWIDVLGRLKNEGVAFAATWAGEGERLDEMRRVVRERGLDEVIALPGKLSREANRALVGSADIFMFCHLAKESPRCLVEALALGTPIVGFASHYAQGLVDGAGGGRFVERGDVAALAATVKDLLADPPALAALTQAAATSGRALDMDKAIGERIRLMKLHLTPRAERRERVDA